MQERRYGASFPATPPLSLYTTTAEVCILLFLPFISSVLNYIKNFEHFP